MRVQCNYNCVGSWLLHTVRWLVQGGVLARTCFRHWCTPACSCPWWESVCLVSLAVRGVVGCWLSFVCMTSSPPAAAVVLSSSFSISLVSDNSVGVFENTECVRIWKYIFISFSSAFRPSRKISRYFMYALCDVCLMIPACNFNPCLFVVFSWREFEWV